MPKQALVTGGNSGIGFAVAQALGRSGYRLWLTGRNPQKGAQAVERLKPSCAAGVAFLAADFTSLVQTERLVKDLKVQLGGKLDALVHSTGVLNSKRVVGAEGFEETWASQFLGRYLVTEALTPELSEVVDGRIVFVGAPLMKSARLHEEDVSLASGYSAMKAAQQSQYACQLYIQSYAAAHVNGPAINGGHVGIVSTDILRGLSGFLGIVFRVLGPLVSIAPDRSAKNFVALASDATLQGVSGYFFPKPERLDVRQRIELPQKDGEALRRICASVDEVKKRVLAA